jgi:hypothetical protein
VRPAIQYQLEAKSKNPHMAVAIAANCTEPLTLEGWLGWFLPEASFATPLTMSVRLKSGLPASCISHSIITWTLTTLSIAPFLPALTSSSSLIFDCQAWMTSAKRALTARAFSRSPTSNTPFKAVVSPVLSLAYLMTFSYVASFEREGVRIPV